MALCETHLSRGGKVDAVMTGVGVSLLEETVIRATAWATEMSAANRGQGNTACGAV